MMKDEIVNQVREVREQQAARLDYDLRTIIAAARERQKDSGHKVASVPVKTKKPA
jgi:hypothetical protein